MDISHLLCQPCDPYMSNKTTNCNFYDSPPESPITPPETTNSSPFFVHRPVPVVFNDTDFWKHHRLLSAASDDVTFGNYYPMVTEVEKPKPSCRKRMNSEMVSVSFHHATSDPFVLTQPPKGRKMSSNSTHARRNRSNSTPMIQTRVPWTPEEDQILVTYIQHYGHENWRALPKQAGITFDGSKIYVFIRALTYTCLRFLYSFAYIHVCSKSVWC